MTVSADDARKAIIAALPEGSTDLYDFEETGYFGRTLTGQASAVKAAGYDQIDRTYLEISPLTCVEKIPDWEAALGLSETPIAKFGTLIQRRGAILGKLRESGTSSLDDIRTAVQPYFMYADQNAIEIIETDRAALRTLNTYFTRTTPLPVVIGAASTGFANWVVRDGPRAGDAGATLYLTLTGTLEQIYVELRGPVGIAVFMIGSLGRGAVVNEPLTLRSKNFVGFPINGNWEMSLITGADPAEIANAELFVEGVGRHPDGSQGLGAAMYEFAVVADPSLLGTGYDIEGAYRAIQRIKPAHTIATIIQKTGADACAIPDTLSAIPDRAIPCL